MWCTCGGGRRGGECLLGGFLCVCVWDPRGQGDQKVAVLALARHDVNEDNAAAAADAPVAAGKVPLVKQYFGIFHGM